MLGELHFVALGPVTPLVSLLFATWGCLLGIVLAARARRCTGWRRARLVAYATAAVAGAGIWQPALVGVLGLRVEGSVVRLAPEGLAMSLGVAVGATMLALLLVCYGSPTPLRPGRATWVLRLIGAGLLFAGGVAGCAHLMVASLTTGGQIAYRTPLAIAAAGVAAASAVGLTRAVAATRSLRGAVGSAVLLGVSLTTIHLAAAASLQVRSSPAGPIPANEVTGLSPMRIGAPAVVVGGFLIALMWYFSVGTATRRDLSLTFDANADADQIEPWMIDQVRARVALSSTAHPARPSTASSLWAQHTVAVRSIPIVGGAVASAFAGAGRAAGSRSSRPGTEHVPPAQGEGGGPAIPAPVAPPMWPLAPAAPVEPDTPPAAHPGARPVPGWGVPGASRSVLAAPTGRDEQEPVPSGQRTGPRWDRARPANERRRDWDSRDTMEQNEKRAGKRGRATNNRQSQLPRRVVSAPPPAPVSPAPPLVPVVGEQSPADEAGDAA
jgi:NO-binding membrane sensor protein with MHYT domain